MQIFQAETVTIIFFLTFLHGNSVIGLQFHLETAKDAITSFIDIFAGESGNGPHIQTAAQMLADIEHIDSNRVFLNGLLEYLSIRLS